MSCKKTSSYTFTQFNNEVNDFYNHLKSNNYSKSEIKKILAPLNSKNTKKLSHPLLILLLITCLLYILSYFESTSWHLSAIARIAMIKLLPYWDWTNWKNAKCLINRAKVPTEITFNCNLCENINKIDVYSEIDEDKLIQNYIDIDVPIILTEGLNFWPSKNTTNFINNLLMNDEFYNSYPCSLSTNTYKTTDIKSGRLLKKVQNFDSFFLHFQNCDLNAMKAFRKFTYRPEFLPRIYSPVTYNWLIWNRNYPMDKYKSVELVEKITVLGQILGSSILRLSARKNCEEECGILEIELKEGEALVLTSLWNLEYRSEGDGENLAAILETRD